MADQQRIFISSVQREFAAERIALRDYLLADPLLRGQFTYPGDIDIQRP